MPCTRSGGASGADSRVRRSAVSLFGELLEAALRCIARNGLAGATHRAIAMEAKLSLSLTTYFFSSRDDLLEQAFEVFSARTLSVSQARLDDLAPLIAASATQPRTQLIAEMTNYILKLGGSR